MANFFDQFDEEEDQVGAQAPASGKNFFDQFDEEPQTPVSPETEAQFEQKKAVLPLPSANMFANMADEDAAEVYDAYVKHPDSKTDENMDVIYRGQVVPRPEGNSGFVDAAIKMGGAVLSPASTVANMLSGGDAEGDTFAESVAGGGLNAVRSVGTGLASAGEWAGILPEGSFEATDEFLPEYNPEGSVAHAGTQVGQIGLGLAAGNKAAALASGLKAVQAVAGSQTAAQIAQVMPKAVSYLANIAVKAVGSSVGAAATQPGGTSTLAVGENALVPLKNFGVGFDEESESAAQEELEARLNIFMDSMMMAYPVEVAADLGKGAINFLVDGWIKPLVGAAHVPTQEKIVLKGIFGKIEAAMGLDDPRAIQKLREEIVRMLKDPEARKVIFKFGKEGMDDVDMTLDTTTILQKQLAGDASPEAESLLASMKGLRKGVTDVMPGGRTAGAVARPERNLDKMLSQTKAVFGGEEAIQESAQRFQGVGRAKVEAAQHEADDLAENLARSQESLPELIKRDEQLGSALARAGDESGSATFQLRNEAGEEIINKLDEGTGIVRSQKNQLWSDMPEGLPFDEESFTAAVSNADEFLSKSLRAEIDNVSDFKSLQNLRNSLNKEIDRRIKRHDLGVEELMALRNNITKDQPAFLRKMAEGDDELTAILDDIGEDAEGIPGMIQEGVDAIDDATTYQKDVYGKVNQGAVKEIDETRSAFGFDEAGRMEEARNILQKTVSSQQPDKVQHLIDTFSRSEYAGKPDRIADYIMADVADKLRTKVKSGGLGEVDVTDVLKTLHTNRQALQRFPEIAKRLDDFENNLIQARGDIKSIEQALAGQKQNVKDIEFEIYEGVLKDFFHKTGQIKGSGYQSFKDLFKDSHGLERLKELTEIARQEDPAVLDGMKVAYSKYLDSDIFSYTPTSTRPKSLSSEKGAATVNRLNESLAYGEVLFKDQPVIMEAVEDLMRLSLDMNAAQKMAAQGESLQQAMRDAVTARNRMVLAFVGPLTRIGARISSISSTILDKIDPNQTVAMIKDKIFADPDEFVRIAEDLFKSQEPNEIARNAFQFLVKAGLYDESDWNNYKEAYDELQAEAQTQEVFNPK